MSQKKTKQLRKKTRKEARRQMEALIVLPFFIRLRLAGRLLRGRRKVKG